MWAINEQWLFFELKGPVAKSPSATDAEIPGGWVNREVVFFAPGGGQRYRFSYIRRAVCQETVACGL